MINTKLKFTVIHPKKTGGTSIHCLFAENGLYPDIPSVPASTDYGPNQTLTFKPQYPASAPGLGSINKHQSLRDRVISLKQMNEEPKDYLFIIPTRNPWDIMLSWYFWQPKNILYLGQYNDELYSPDAFTVFIKDATKQFNIEHQNIINGYKDYKHYFINANNQLNQLNAVFAFVNIHFKEIKHKNKNSLRKHVDYRKYYTHETMKIVKKEWKEYIELLGYEFGSQYPRIPVIKL